MSVTAGSSAVASSEEGYTDDVYDYFESSLESLFGQHQAASGRPGERCRLELGGGLGGGGKRGGAVVEYRIPCNQDAGNNRLYAHYQWDAGVELARMLYNDKGLVQRKSVLELGAGTGLPSLVCAREGASKVLITDYPDEGIISTIRENIEMNEVGRVATAKGLDWSDKASVERVWQESLGGYDLILCADVLWLSSSHASLLQTIKRLLCKSSKARVILLSGFHTGRRALLGFFRRAAEMGLRCDWDEESVFEYNVSDEKTRPWSGTSAFPTIDQQGGRQGEEEEGEDNMDDYTERTKWLLHVSLRWAKVEGSD